MTQDLGHCKPKDPGMQEITDVANHFPAEGKALFLLRPNDKLCLVCPDTTSNMQGVDCRVVCQT
jgi:hypothetical protein